MRRVLKAVVLDRDPGDITTIEEEGSVEEARKAMAGTAGDRRSPGLSGNSHARSAASAPNRYQIATCDLVRATIRSCRDLIQAHHRDVYAAAAPPRGGWGPRSLQLIG